MKQRSWVLNTIATNVTKGTIWLQQDENGFKNCPSFFMKTPHKTIVMKRKREIHLWKRELSGSSVDFSFFGIWNEHWWSAILPAAFHKNNRITKKPLPKFHAKITLGRKKEKSVSFWNRHIAGFKKVLDDWNPTSSFRENELEEGANEKHYRYSNKAIQFASKVWNGKFLLLHKFPLYRFLKEHRITAIKPVIFQRKNFEGH